jgi:peptidoglycan/xylan/chitin deacetylase (PgdA/CDA1 family)
VYAVPILNKFGFSADFFIVTDFIGTQKLFPWLKMNPQTQSHYNNNQSLWLPLSEAELINMENKGHKINSHSKTHSKLNSLKEYQIETELKNSKDRIENILKEK